MPTPERASEAHPGWEDGSGAARGARPRRLARALRICRVALCFAYFGAGAWGLGATLLPLVTWVARRRGLPEDARTRRVQRIAQLYYRSFIGVMQRVTRVCEVEWVNAEVLTRGPLLIVVNHPSLIDTPLLGSKLPQADFVVGPEWMRNRWMRRAIVALGYLNSEDGAAVVGQAAERLRAGRTLVMYPEGSRTPAEGLRPFQRGAAHVALEVGCDILPVVLHVTPRVLMKGQPWLRYPLDNPVWRIEVGEPIRLPVGDAGESRSLAARRLTAVLEEHFQKRWVRGRS
jgi:1-acyl-sn-glycerol-3-phosphate acyltransferase